MSSGLRSTANIPGQPLINWVNGPCMLIQQNRYEPPAGVGYESGDGGPPINLLFQSLIPFSYKDNVLEIEFETPVFSVVGLTSFPETMMTTISGESTPHLPTYFNFPATSQVRLMGGQNLVTDIGPNFKEYIETVYGSIYSPVTDIEVYSSGIVTKVQILDARSLGTWLGIINPILSGGPDPLSFSGDSSVPPSGSYVPNYPGAYQTYVFLSPLTIAVTTQSNGVRYFTLKSQISS